MEKTNVCLKTQQLKNFGVYFELMTRNSHSRRRMGPKTQLSAGEETLLMDSILSMARTGIAVHPENLFETSKNSDIVCEGMLIQEQKTWKNLV